MPHGQIMLDYVVGDNWFLDAVRPDVVTFWTLDLLVSIYDDLKAI